MSEESWEPNIPAEACLASRHHSFISTLESGRCEEIQARSYWLRSLSGYQQGSDTTKDIQITFLSRFPLTKGLTTSFKGWDLRESAAEKEQVPLSKLAAAYKCRGTDEGGGWHRGPWWSWPQSLPIHSQTDRLLFFVFLRPVEAIAWALAKVTVDVRSNETDRLSWVVHWFSIKLQKKKQNKLPRFCLPIYWFLYVQTWKESQIKEGLCPTLSLPWIKIRVCLRSSTNLSFILFFC